MMRMSVAMRHETQLFQITDISKWHDMATYMASMPGEHAAETINSVELDAVK